MALAPPLSPQEALIESQCDLVTELRFCKMDSGQIEG